MVVLIDDTERYVEKEGVIQTVKKQEFQASCFQGT